MNKFLKISLFLLVAASISSCKLMNPSQMLRTEKDFKYSEFPTNQAVDEYKIAPNDELTLRLFTNEGEKIIDPVNAATNNVANGLTANLYTVEFDGMVKLPIINRTKLSGLTLREAEKLLETKYEAFYKKPFVQLKVTNNRVIIFPGGLGGTSTVLTLTNTNTTLFEALAKAGGIVDGKASKIKLIRGNLQDPKVYLIDLSTLKGMKQADLVLQANDIIYVEPRGKVLQKVLEGVTPVLTIISSVILVYGLVK
ncbi:MAG: polysaccharide biosynthesis/export family protein [Bacteroidetes bacterium]|nr:polysaccharide biosynthesis/export family protein [Bacteroidota bacterium]